MAVAFDAATETANWTTTPDPFTFTHTPSGTPRGVLVFTIGSSASSTISAVTYGGVSVAAVSGGTALDTLSAEAGFAQAWFLGASIPTGAQTVSIDHDASGNQKYAVCITVTASSDTEISGTPVLLQEDGTLAEQNVDTGATEALRFAALWTGLATPPSAGASSTLVHDLDVGGFGMSVVRETTGGSGSRPVGFSSGTSDDRAAVHLAVAESGGGGGGTVTRSYVVIGG